MREHYGTNWETKYQELKKDIESARAEEQQFHATST
jgi:hypothetical protein